jgi:hypothetical protein
MSDPTSISSAPDRRWLSLGVIGLAQLMVVLDLTVMNIALLNTIFAGAAAAYLTAHLATARLAGHPAPTGLALAHGHDTAFWWMAGIFAAGAAAAGALLRRGPLGQQRTPSPAHGGVATAPARASQERVQ